MQIEILRFQYFSILFSLSELFFKLFFNIHQSTVPRKVNLSLQFASRFAKFLLALWNQRANSKVVVARPVLPPLDREEKIFLKKKARKPKFLISK